MSAFEFFFGFYGLILGLAVVEIVGGFSRVLKAGRLRALGLCLPLLALYVLLDLIQFWVDTWSRHPEPNINAGVLTVALAIAGIYYLAASLVFPARPEDADFGDHYDRHKRWVAIASLLASLLSGTVLPVLTGQPELVLRLATPAVAGFLLLWAAPLVAICFIRNRRINAALLAWQCLFYLVLTFAEAISAVPGAAR